MDEIVVTAKRLPGIIDLIDASLINAAAPEQSPSQLAQWVRPVKVACQRFGIDTVREIAAYLGQGAHESGGLRYMAENLNYRASRLCEVWPKRFNATLAAQCAGNPEMIANIVYANRMGNGPPSSGDGWRFRGAGLFQLTGRFNHTRCAGDLGMSLDGFGDYLRTPDGAAMSAAWFFHENGLDALAATPGIEDETRRLNGGVLGLADRKKRFDAVVRELLRRAA